LSDRLLSELTVVVPPRVLDDGDGGAQAVSQSGRVVLNCPVVAGDPPPDITWFRNDSRVQLTDRTSQLTNGSLVIYDVTVRRPRPHTSNMSKLENCP